MARVKYLIVEILELGSPGKHREMLARTRGTLPRLEIKNLRSKVGNGPLKVNENKSYSEESKLER